MEAVVIEGDVEDGDGRFGGEAVAAGGRIEDPADLRFLITAVFEPQRDIADDA